MKNLAHHLHWLFACLFMLVFLHGNYSQETIKFGKIDIKDLKMSRCPFDSSADAMVLGDIGKTYFAYDEQEGFMMMFERFVRIKIFTKKLCVIDNILKISWGIKYPKKVGNICGIR